VALARGRDQHQTRDPLTLPVHASLSLAPYERRKNGGGGGEEEEEIAFSSKRVHCRVTDQAQNGTARTVLVLHRLSHQS